MAGVPGPGVVVDPVTEVGEARTDRGTVASADVVVHPGQEPAPQVALAQRPAGQVQLARRRRAARVTPRLPHHPHRRAVAAQRAVGGHRLLQVEQRVVLPLHQQGRRVHAAGVPGHRGVPGQPQRGRGRVAERLQLGERGAGGVDEVRAADVALRVDLRVVDAVDDAQAEEQVGPQPLVHSGRAVGDPAGETGVVRRERVGQVVPGDDRDQRVHPPVLHRHGVLHLAAVGAADHAHLRVVRDVAAPFPGHGPHPALAAGGVVGVGVPPRQHADQLAACLAVPVRVVEVDLAAGAAEPEPGVGEDHVALPHEAACGGPLLGVVLAAAEAVRGQDRRRAVPPVHAGRRVEVGADRARVVAVRP